MASRAPVCSPTPIICTTIGGKTPLSFRGWATVRPLSTPFRTAMIASSMMALPEVRAVISRPSRMGTPEAMRVARVRQQGAQAFEHGGEGRDDLPEDDGDDDAGDPDDRDGIDHRALDLALELDRLLDVRGQALQDGVEDTARLAGRDHVDEEVVEGLGVLPHGVGEGSAAFHVHARLLQDLREGLVLLLAAQDLEALDQGETGVDHDRE